MADVFLSYKREDWALANAVAQALRDDGLDVWWDQGITPGENWSQEIEAALQTARAVVVLWTPASIGPEGGFVRDEARRGLARGVLVPAIVGTDTPPLGFGEVQAIRLDGWNRGGGKAVLAELVAATRARLGSEPRPAGKPRKQVVSGRRWAWLFTAAGLLLLVASGAAWVGLGGSSDDAWAQRRPGNCDDIRKFAVDGNPHADEARRLLAAAKNVPGETWEPLEREWRSAVRASEAPFALEAEARVDAQARAETDAASLGCAPRDQFEKLNSVDMTSIALDCRADPRGGHSCSASYVAKCKMERRAPVERC